MAKWLHRLRNLPALWRSARALAGAAISAKLGAVTFLGMLSVRHYDAAKDRWVEYGIVSARVVTNAAVDFLVDDWDNNATDITNMNQHASGTGVAAESVTDVALGAEVATRVAGVKSQPVSNQLRTVATIPYGGAFAITEHGIFSAAAAGTLWDRSVFAAINVASGDSIEFTYTCTVNAGG